MIQFLLLVSLFWHNRSILFVIRLLHHRRWQCICDIGFVFFRSFNHKLVYMVWIKVILMLLWSLASPTIGIISMGMYSHLITCVGADRFLFAYFLLRLEQRCHKTEFCVVWLTYRFLQTWNLFQIESKYRLHPTIILCVHEEQFELFNFNFQFGKRSIVNHRSWMITIARAVSDAVNHMMEKIIKQIKPVYLIASLWFTPMWMECTFRWSMGFNYLIL